MMGDDNYKSVLSSLKERPTNLPRANLVLEVTSEDFLEMSTDRRIDEILQNLPNARSFKPGSIEDGSNNE